MALRGKHISDRLLHHLRALWYVITVLVPVIIRTRKRPVLFDKYSGIGDIICTFPAALALKKRHPGHPFIYNCHKEFACLPSLGGVTSHVTSTPNIGYVSFWYKFLLAASYNFASDDDHAEQVPSDVYIKDFGRYHGVAVDEMHPCLQIPNESVARIRARVQTLGVSPENLVAIHCGPSWPVREWPLEKWAALVAELNRKGISNVVRLGTGHHLALGKIEGEEIPGTVSLLDQLSLEETVALIAQASLFIGIDSGLLHIAAATRTPCVGLWGATSPQFRFCTEIRKHFVTATVDCQGCHHRFPRQHWMTGCPRDIACMKGISVEEVLAACWSQFQSQPISR